MTSVSRNPTSSLAEHPDILEMRQRYAHVHREWSGSGDRRLVLLAGLCWAISPWVVHFNSGSPLRTCDEQPDSGDRGRRPALGLTMMPERMYRLSWATVAIGLCSSFRSG